MKRRASRLARHSEAGLHLVVLRLFVLPRGASLRCQLAANQVIYAERVPAMAAQRGDDLGWQLCLNAPPGFIKIARGDRRVYAAEEARPSFLVA
jgi:hypothetical protein